MHRSNVLQLQPSQIEAASEIVANVFMADPVLSYLTPNDSELQFHALSWLTSRLMAYCIQYGYVYTTTDLQGVAAWFPPSGKSSTDMLQQLKMALELQVYQFPVKVGWNRLARWLNALYVLEKAQQEDMGESPYWELGLMAVRSESQGQGIGSQLLQPILRRASDEGISCSVITATELAVQFYQKNGFEIARKQKLAANAPPFWILRHNP